MIHRNVSRLLVATMAVGLLSACAAPKYEEVDRGVGGGKGMGGQSATNSAGPSGGAKSGTADPTSAAGGVISVSGGGAAGAPEPCILNSGRLNLCVLG